MAYAYITDNTATQVHTGPVSTAEIMVNGALTGTIKVIDGTSGSTANVATITDPTVGSRYVYHDLSTGFRVIASTTCNITASATDRMMAR